MAKKKNNPGMMPDLFADFGAGSDATNEQNEEKEPSGEREGEESELWTGETVAVGITTTGRGRGEEGGVLRVG